MSDPISAPDFTSPSALAYMMESGIEINSDEDVASLPSITVSDSDIDGRLSDYSDDESDAEAEWRESMQQLELLLTMVVIPFAGKFLGRKCAYWGWARFMEWKYPIEINVGKNNKTAFRKIGSVKTSASL